MQDYQETLSKEDVDSVLALMVDICNSCRFYQECVLDPPIECEVFKKEVQKRRN